MDHLANADQAFTTAISKNPDYFSPYLARGVLRHERGQKSRGLADIKRSYELLPTPAASYYLGEQAMVARQYSQASQYFNQATQGGGELSARAQQQLGAIQLRLKPESFIQTQLLLSDRRELLVRTSNKSPVTMSGIQLRLTIGGQAQILRLPQPLGSGQTATLSTGIGPIEDASSGYRIEAVAAVPTQ